MNTNPQAIGPVELLLLAALVTIEALAVLLAAATALLLTLTGWRPADPAAAAPANAQAIAPAPAPASPDRVNITPTPSAEESPQRGTPPSTEGTSPAGAALAALRVVELRRLARAAGHRQLARSGRRAQLLEALAA